MYQNKSLYIKYKKMVDTIIILWYIYIIKLLLSEPAGHEPAIRIYILYASYVPPIILKTVKFYEHSEIWVFFFYLNVKIDKNLSNRSSPLLWLMLSFVCKHI